MAQKEHLLRRFGCIAVVGALAAMLTATARAAAPNPEIPAYWPRWLKDAMRRESRQKPPTTVDLGDGLIVAPVRGELLAEPQTAEYGWYFSLAFGPIQPMECWVFSEPQLLATTLQSTRQVRSKEIQAESGGVPYRHNTLYYNDAGVYDDVPYLATERMYMLETEPQTTLGMLKVRAADKDGATFVCSHHELGYRKTFTRAFRELVTKAEVNLPQLDHYYREIVAITSDDVPVGITSRVYSLDDAGDTIIQTTTTMLTQVGDSVLATSDTTQLEFASGDGALINAYHTHIENGELSFDLALNVADDGGWYIDGEHRGEALTKSLEDGRQPTSTLGRALSIADVVATKDRSRAELPVWLPQTDPARLLDGYFEVEKRRRRKSSGQLALGPITMDASVDERGSLLEAVYDRAGRSMRLERVHEEGTLDPGSTGD